jgi:ribosomal protein L11 methyltransferase
MRRPEADKDSRASDFGPAIQTLHHLIEASRGACAVAEVEAAIRSRHALPRSTTRKLLRRLVAQGVIEYRLHCGQSCLAYSFQGPQRVSPRLIVVPPHVALPGRPGDLPLVIESGAAFGDGRHPTTCLALGGLDALFSGAWPTGGLKGHACLDIGTGSGILAIAAARLGATRVLALDLEPCAVIEAQHNVALNGVSSQVLVIQQPVESVAECFDVVLANLRPPTLVGLAGWVAAHLKPAGAMILSGFRPEEWAPVARAYGECGLALCWQAEKAGWAAAGMRITPQQS